MKRATALFAGLLFIGSLTLFTEPASAETEKTPQTTGTSTSELPSGVLTADTAADEADAADQDDVEAADEASVPSPQDFIQEPSELRGTPDNGSMPSRFSNLLDLNRPTASRPLWGTYNVPVFQTPKVESHMRYFHTRIRDRFEAWMARLQHYHPLVESIFAEFNLPTDLVYLSLVESGFNPHAYSRARATGPWQFMKGTAKVYGLRVDSYVDERRDPIKSTVAAARYLRDLFDLLGSWPLAMAAYNAGEGKVMRAMQKSRSEDFDDLARTRLLRRETKEYVPRFMAATIIAKNPEQFGFDPDEDLVPHQFDEVIVLRPIALHALANATGISLQELKRLNPELRRDGTPPDGHEYHLKVPVGHKITVEQALDKVPIWNPPPLVTKRGSVYQAHVKDGWYRVRVGDSLATIAKRFRLSVHDLKSRNRLSGRKIRPGDLLAIAPQPH
jgi:membrane-bound lytic murein transglycosylase D